MDRKQFISLAGLTGLTTIAGGIYTHCSHPNQSPNKSGKARIRFEKYKLELWHDWTITRGTATFKENVFVYYERDGITGIGEAGHMTAAGQDADKTVQALELLIPLYEAHPPFEYFNLPFEANKILPGLVPAKAALDIALMDWIGKKINLPLYKFYGLNPDTDTKTSFSIGRDSPEVMIQKVKEAAPYHILKIKLTNQNDEEVINTIRSATDKPIRVDINEGWTDKEDAIRKIEWMSKRGVELIEQPMPVDRIEETAWLKDRSPVPVVADEAVHTSADMAAISGAYHGVNIKLMKSGGLIDAHKMCILAQSMGLDIMIGCMIESSVAISAAVHLQPFARWLDLDGNLLISNDPFRGALFENGQWTLPDGYGIGVSNIQS